MLNPAARPAPRAPPAAAAQVTSGDAACAVPPQLAAKYSLAEDNVQRVISVTNR